VTPSPPVSSTAAATCSWGCDVIIDDGDLAKHIEDAQAVASSEWNRLEYFERYFRGDQEPPYTPPTSTREYKALVPRSITNLTRLVINTMVQRCIIDGYRASSTDVENAAPWQWWQANGMDSRQKALWEETGKHGYASMLVLPASFRDAAYDHRTAPIMQPVSPREWYVHMDSWSDDWPQWAIRRDAHDPDKWWIVDDERLRVVKSQRKPNRLLTIDRDDVHGFEVVPFVPFRNAFDLTRAPIGEIEPIIPIQDRLNQTVFDLLVATTYSSAPQKWIAGMAVPTDEASGQPIIDLKAFAKSVWLSDDPTTKFGSLPEANLSNIVTAIDSTLRVYGLMSQTPPHYLLGDLVNLSAEALLAADTTLAKKIQDHQMIWGEAVESAFRLAAVAAGDMDAADDESSQVMWRATEPRSVAQQVDALGKMATMLGIPTEALWEQVPGVTSTDLELWRAMRARDRLRAATQAALMTPPPPLPGTPAVEQGPANPTTAATQIPRTA